MICGLAIIILGLGALTESYTVNYFDCTKPKSVLSYDVSAACKRERVWMKRAVQLMSYFKKEKSVNYKGIRAESSRVNLLCIVERSRIRKWPKFRKSS